MNRRIRIEATWIDTGVEFSAYCMIGKYDCSIDDDIFFWFTDEQDVNGNMNNSRIASPGEEFKIKSWEYVK